MGIRTKRIKGGNGINYTKEVDGPSDWSGIAYNTYFKDLSDGLIYWRDLSGTFIAIYELAGITGDTNTYTTGATLNGTILYYDRTDALSAYTVDISSIIPVIPSGGTGDYGNIIFVSEVGPTGQTRNDVIGEIMRPVELNWASSIALSGDTIHVKAGSYTANTTTGVGLSVNGVNHFFEENSKVYCSTAYTIFSMDTNLGILNGGNVYGNGSFYPSGTGSVLSGTFNGGYTGFFSNTSVFEFDECVSTSTANVISFLTSGDVIIRGKNRIISSSGNTIYILGSTNEKLIIDCPYISTSNPGSNCITFGAGAGGGNTMTIISDVIEATGNPSDYAINNVGSDGNLSCKATYINRIKFVDDLREVNIKASRIDYIEGGANIFNIDAHVGHLHLSQFTTANITLCDEFNIANAFGPLISTANITMTNVTGATNIFQGGGELNLRSSELTNRISNQVPGSNTIYPIGPKSYYINASNGIFNLLGKWDNIDTITHLGTTTSKLRIDSNAHIEGAKIYASGGRLEINGKTTDCDINYTGGTIVINGATMLVSNQNKHIITTPSSGKSIKVYSGGLNTNKFGPLTGATEMLKVTVSGKNTVLTVNTETFTSITGNTAATSAAELVTLINASGTLAATASQDTPYTDEYLYVTSDTVGTGLTMVYGFNTSFGSQIRDNSNPITDIVGGTIIEDIDID